MLRWEEERVAPLGSEDWQLYPSFLSPPQKISGGKEGLVGG